MIKARTGREIGEKTRDSKGRSHSPVKGRKSKRSGRK
jgi:hypothetical protein